MKRSKIFLSVTTVILAAVGISAVKRFSGTTRYYLTTAAKYCGCSSPELCIRNLNALHTCQTVINGTAYVLFTKGPCGVIGTTNKCTNALKYDTTGE